MSGRGAERVLALIEWVAQRGRPFVFMDVVNEMNLPKSSALSLLRLLVGEGYLHLNQNRTYTLARLPGQPTADRPAWGVLKSTAAPIVEDAVRGAGESGFLAVLEPDLNVRYLLSVLPQREIRYDRDVSIPRRPHQVSAGIVLLGGFGADDLTTYIDKERAEGRFEGDTDALRHRVAQVRQDGVCIVPHGVVEGAAGLSAPVRDASGAIIAALNIAGPAGRMANDLDRISVIVRAAAATLSQAITMLRQPPQIAQTLMTSAEAKQ